MSEHRTFTSVIRYYVKWILLSAVVGVACGVASAIFLASLQFVTETREAHPWLLFLLPVGGLLVGAVYHQYGRKVEGGNNLMIDEFHDPQSVIPFRMAPLVLFGTLLTHFFGGSAGREGTAVQMGGSIADQLTSVLKINRVERRTLLMAGMSGGFGSVFGVPLAGALFGLEVMAVDRLHLWGIVECAAAAYSAHSVTLALGIHHTEYFHPDVSQISLLGVSGLSAVVAGIAFGLTARLFGRLTETIAKFLKARIPLPAWRAFVGGVCVSAIYLLLPVATRYAGLGVPIIAGSLKTELPLYDWAGKLVLTALTLGSGFKGGEVTPLLFVGATLGNALSHVLAIPMPLLAAMGFVGVFAGAANTPFACTVMAMELFGGGVGAFAAIACLVSFAASGHRGIYHAQRIHVPRQQYVSRTQDFFRYLFRRPSL